MDEQIIKIDSHNFFYQALTTYPLDSLGIVLFVYEGSKPLINPVTGLADEAVKKAASVAGLYPRRITVTDNVGGRFQQLGRPVNGSLDLEVEGKKVHDVLVAITQHYDPFKNSVLGQLCSQNYQVVGGVLPNSTPPLVEFSRRAPLGFRRGFEREGGLVLRLNGNGTAAKLQAWYDGLKSYKP